MVRLNFNANTKIEGRAQYHLHNYKLLSFIQGVRATNLIVSTAKFMITLEAEVLRPYVLPTRPNPYNEHMIKLVQIESFFYHIIFPIISLSVSVFNDSLMLCN